MSSTFAALSPFLSFDADLRQDQMARVAFDLFIGQLRAVFDDRIEFGEVPARNRRHDGDLVAFRDGRVVALGADVLVVDVYPHEIAQFAVVTVQDADAIARARWSGCPALR
jgi:hypothetical protein